MDPELETVEAISRASVIIDCTPSGVGHKNKEQYYSKFADKVKGFMAQGSEDGFGIKYARGINDSIFCSQSIFVNVNWTFCHYLFNF